MIISKILGGLGNQMYQYAIAKSIAVKNNDSFKLDVSGFESYSLHNGYRLNLFNIDGDVATHEDIVSLKGHSTVVHKVLKKLNIYKVDTFYREKEITLFDKEVFNYGDLYLDGYWQNELYFQDIRDILLTEFTLKDGISKSMISIQEQIENSESVSIHVRRGDYLNHPDDIQWCKDNFTFIDKCHFLEEGGTELDDMTLMSKCSHNIIANSSFSWWGAWLNNKSNRIIIAPKKWMAINPNNYKWASSDWLEL
jgi:hypothetical protein